MSRACLNVSLLVIPLSLRRLGSISIICNWQSGVRNRNLRLRREYYHSGWGEGMGIKQLLGGCFAESCRGRTKNGTIFAILQYSQQV